ncbi:exo-beta-N-acetylmuramidase NamZ family protein [Alicyclobacillus macrosporangiidus]|uniref:Uncharacterized conserved protein YbbC, DUF1343 family n=1 Tax=Alicyclobacillus macrosporangiidus TaxID=392015 RepID=A0A1I7G9G4_9BACL|nr:DUF1343 domain-containing protein [Alicyclobacillus macrosporangiidus]SFU45083.1 Uncharacterized conserved protein YbbC, DUF1343 family [Alicyclobacillus macrosporangiidus]
MVRLGIERLVTEERHILSGKRVGLVTHYAMVDRNFRCTVDILVNDPAWTVVKLFGPEHGLLNCGREGEEIFTQIDEHTGLVAYSLYGPQYKPTADMLEGIDVLVIDLPDIGSRYYTNISTMVYCLEACAEVGIPCVVLDRPNPIGGMVREGNLQEPGYLSFVGCFPLPNRHGLTMGELAVLYHSTLTPSCPLTVVRMEGWRRRDLLPDTGLPFIPVSMNTTRLDMALLYPGTCLFEGTNLSEGRGTAHPFEFIGAPFIDGHRVAARFNALRLPGVVARPVYFVPTYQKYNGELCQGVQLHVVDRQSLQPVRTGILLLQLIAEMYPESFAFQARHKDGRLAFDLLAGTDRLRRWILTGEADRYLEEAASEVEVFHQQVRDVLLYS